MKDNKKRDQLCERMICILRRPVFLKGIHISPPSQGPLISKVACVADDDLAAPSLGPSDAFLRRYLISATEPRSRGMAAVGVANTNPAAPTPLI